MKRRNKRHGTKNKNILYRADAHRKRKPKWETSWGQNFQMMIHWK